ncbi:hypothetical protein M422DRAFT_244760, partial [Sphaerobolus stellatus SS14]
MNPTESMRLRRDTSPINTWHKPVSVNTHDRPSLSASQVIRGIPESIEHSQHSIADPQSIDMNALREEIKATISATIKEKLHSDADSLAEEKVNNLLHKEAPEEALLEAAREACTICFQLDQNTRLREAGLMPEQQVRFSADTGRNAPSPSRNYRVNPIREEHTPQPEDNAPFGRQGTPALSISAQLDGAVVNMTSEYSGIQQMVRQALQNASLEDEPEKSFLAKAS